VRLSGGLLALWVFGGVVAIVVLAADISEYWLVAAPVLVGVAYLFFQTRQRASERGRHEPATATKPLQRTARRGDKTRRQMIRWRVTQRGVEARREVATTDLLAALEASIGASKRGRARSPKEAAYAEALAKLPEHDRYVLLLLLGAESSDAELAGHLGMTETGFAAHKQQLLEKLREAVPPE
jgi:hypothetical protein